MVWKIKEMNMISRKTIALLVALGISSVAMHASDWRPQWLRSKKAKKIERLRAKADLEWHHGPFHTDEPSSMKLWDFEKRVRWGDQRRLEYDPNYPMPYEGYWYQKPGFQKKGPDKGQPYPRYELSRESSPAATLTEIKRRRAYAAGQRKKAEHLEKGWFDRWYSTYLAQQRFARTQKPVTNIDLYEQQKPSEAFHAGQYYEFED
jgi:hypothetical protein